MDMDEAMRQAQREMREVAEKIGCPYVSFTIEGDMEGMSPLQALSLHFELLVNSLMLKWARTENEDNISYLAFLQATIENFALLTSEIGLRSAGFDPQTGEKQNTDYQIPDIFKKGLEDTDLNLN